MCWGAVSVVCRGARRANARRNPRYPCELIGLPDCPTAGRRFLDQRPLMTRPPGSGQGQWWRRMASCHPSAIGGGGGGGWPHMETN